MDEIGENVTDIDYSDRTKYDPNKNRLYEHPEGSPYKGLTLEEQRVLSIIRRGKKKAPKAILRKMKKATKLDYGKILRHCVNALIEGSSDVDTRLDRIRVVLELPFNFRKTYSPDWPRGVILGYKDWSTIMQYKTDTLIDYLHSIGESTFDSKTLRKHLWEIRRDLDKLLWLEQYTIPLCTMEFLNEAVPVYVEERIERKSHGRRLYRKSGKRSKKEENVEESLDKSQ